MSDQKERLDINTPIASEDLSRFSQLQMARLQIADRVLELEQEKIRAMRAAANVDTERQKLFEKVLADRGLPPNYPVEIDSKTGQIKIVEEAMEAYMRQQAQSVPPTKNSL